jgi:hypothetical protein
MAWYLVKHGDNFTFTFTRDVLWISRKEHRYEALTVKVVYVCYNSVVYHWATGWMIGGSSPGKGWEFFSSPPRPYRAGA